MLRKVFVHLLRLVPFGLVFRLYRYWLLALVARDPKEGIKRLFLIQDATAVEIEKLGIRLGDGIHIKHRLMDYHRFFVERIHPGDCVLDIGCGIGAVAHSIAEKTGAKVLGVDLNPANIAFAQSHFSHPRLEYRLADATRDLPSGTYTVIVLSNVLEHIEDRKGFLNQVQTTLQPKRWLVRVPIRERHWTVALRNQMGLDSRLDPTHQIEYTEEEFCAEVEKAGFTVDSISIKWCEIWCEMHAG